MVWFNGLTNLIQKQPNVNNSINFAFLPRPNNIYYILIVICYGLAECSLNRTSAEHSDGIKKVALEGYGPMRMMMITFQFIRPDQQSTRSKKQCS